MVGEISGALRGSFEAMSSSVNTFQDRFEAMTTDLSDVILSVNKSVEIQRTVLNDSMEASIAAQRRSEEAATEVAAAQNVAVSIASLAEKLGVMQRESLQTIEKQVGLQAEAQSNADAVARQIQAATTAYTDAASTLQELLPTMSESVVSLSESVQGVAEASELSSNQLLEAVGGLSECLKDEQTLLSGYEEASDSFIRAFGQTEGAFTAMGALAERLRSEQDRIQKLVEASERAHLSLSAAADTLESTMSQSEGALRQATEGLANVAGETEDWAEKATSAIEAFGTGLNKAVTVSMEEYDKQLAIAVQRLNDLTVGLHDVIEEVQEILEKNPPSQE
jgi:hypothetical protein